jgi:putative nucleotidyltransferase with HDIG domain
MPEENGNGKDEKMETGGLKNLLDSSYPLLQRFREACPGTFKHSQALSAMIENIALSLELDIDHMKVAAMYHDIGKMFNPKYFTENQLDDENPHDKLDAVMSYNIITRHVSDSVAILINDQNFPRRLIEIISQHHGKSLLKYFLNKSNKEAYMEDAFRYKTCKPKCIESAILMICDRVEATSKSLVQAGKFDPSKIINGTIGDLIDDGQLDDVVMRLGDLKKIKDALAKDLEGTYQKRVDYDIDTEEKSSKTTKKD